MPGHQEQEALRDVLLAGAVDHPERVGEGEDRDGRVDREAPAAERAPARWNISISCAAAANAYGTSVVIVARMMIFVNVSVSDDW